MISADDNPGLQLWRQSDGSPDAGRCLLVPSLAGRYHCGGMVVIEHSMGGDDRTFGVLPGVVTGMRVGVGHGVVMGMRPGIVRMAITI